MNLKMLSFIKDGFPVLKKYGFDPYIVLAQACLESDYFTRVIGMYNLFGIKKPFSWKGKVVNVTTHEYVKGKNIKVVAAFIDFDTIDELIDWYVSLIKRLYPQAYANRTDAVKYFSGLVDYKYKYATDPKYKQKLLSVYKVVKNITV